MIGPLYFRKTNTVIEKEIRFVVIRVQGWVRENWVKAVRRYKLPTRSTH